MIIMKKDASREQIKHVVDEIKKRGLKADVSKGEFRAIVGLVGDETKISFAHLATLPGVKEARMVEAPYKLISREYSSIFEEEGQSRLVKVGDIEIGGNEPVYIAGPCAVESKEQLFKIAQEVKEAGAHILRGGIFKPRTSVHSFQGLGAAGRQEAEEALSWLKEAGQRFGLD